MRHFGERLLSFCILISPFLSIALRDTQAGGAKDIFGNARPVDTRSREKEIEEKIKRQERPETPSSSAKRCEKEFLNFYIEREKEVLLVNFNMNTFPFAEMKKKAKLMGRRK